MLKVYCSGSTKAIYDKEGRNAGIITFSTKPISDTRVLWEVELPEHEAFMFIEFLKNFYSEENVGWPSLYRAYKKPDLEYLMKAFKSVEAIKARERELLSEWADMSEDERDPENWARDATEREMYE